MAAGASTGGELLAEAAEAAVEVATEPLLTGVAAIAGDHWYNTQVRLM